VEIEISKHFMRDVNKISDKRIQKKIQEVLVCVRSAVDLSDIKNLGEMSGYAGFYRIKFDYRYRIGIYLERDTVKFLRAGSREGVYKRFPS